MNGNSIIFFFPRITAYTLSAFRQASEFIYIDEDILKRGYEWLADKQGRNGSFYEIGNEIHSDMQDRNGNSLPLTSFVLLSFLENQVGSIYSPFSVKLLTIFFSRDSHRNTGIP